MTIQTKRAIVLFTTFVTALGILLSGASGAGAVAYSPSWKIQVIVYKNTDFTYSDSAGLSHHFVGAMTPSDLSVATTDATDFVNTDIPALTSGVQHPVITIKTIDASLSTLEADGVGGFSPTPATAAADLGASFDSHIVMWMSSGWDFTTASNDNIAHQGALTWPMGTSSTFSAIPMTWPLNSPHSRNVFKHEWGHAILFYYDAAGAAPKPAVDNHHPETSVNCQTGQPYVLQDESLANPIPNSIFNNSSGFTHDYYSGITANSSAPTQCIGITPAAWASGGPVTRPALASPDLTVTALSWTPTTPVPGSPVKFLATIKNQGTAATPGGVVHGVAFLVDGVNVSYSDTDTASLAPGASITLTATGSNAGGSTWAATRGKHTVTAWVDDASRIAESNETNNKLVKAMNVYASVAPSSVAITTGTLRGGTVSSLAEADGISYRVNSTAGGTRTTTWAGTAPNIPNTTAGLQITYRGAVSASTSQTLSIWNFSTSAWVTLKTSAAGTSAVTSVIVPTGTQASYVSGNTGNGTVKVQLKNTSGTSSFYSSADFLSIAYL